MLETNENVTNDLGKRLSLSPTLANTAWPVIRGALAPIVWEWFDANQDEVIFHYKLDIKIIISLRPSISLRVRDFRPLIKSIFGNHP